MVVVLGLVFELTLESIGVTVIGLVYQWLSHISGVMGGEQAMSSLEVQEGQLKRMFCTFRSQDIRTR